MAKNWTRKRLRALNWPNSGNVSTRLLRKGGYPRGHFSFFVFGFCLMAEESLGEIGDFLKNLGLVEYLPSLLDHGIENLEVLRLIDLENLVQIGITRENARLILDRLANPNDPAPVPVRAPVPVPSQNDRGSGEEFEIFLKTMTGGTLTLEVTTQTTVDGLIDIIQQKEGLPRDQITLIWATKQISMKEPCLWSQKGNSIVLWDGTPLRTFPNPQYCHIYTTLKDVESLIPQSKLAEFREYRAAQDAQIRAFHARTLTSHNIQNESTLHLQVHLRGDIGLFDLHLETPGIDLLQAPKNLNGEGLEVKEIIEKVKENKHVPIDRKSNRFESYSAEDKTSLLLLSNEECQILKDFLDQKFFGEVESRGSSREWDYSKPNIKRGFSGYDSRGRINGVDWRTNHSKIARLFQWASF